jgi:hypothetical protein
MILVTFQPNISYLLRILRGELVVVCHICRVRTADLSLAQDRSLTPEPSVVEFLRLVHVDERLGGQLEGYSEYCSQRWALGHAERLWAR